MAAGFPLITDAGPEIVQTLRTGFSALAITSMVAALTVAIALRRGSAFAARRDPVPAHVSPYDAALARRANAEAEKLEREIRAEDGAPEDDGTSPVDAIAWTVTARPDLCLVYGRITDSRGRDYGLSMKPEHARDVACALLEAARRAERGER